MVASTFPRLTLSAQKPPNSAYPKELKTIGEHIRKRRLDLELFQKDVAKVLGITKGTVSNWEKNLAVPKLFYIPKIIEFLGYIPFEIGESLPDMLRGYRRLCGLSKRGASCKHGVDVSTWWKWEDRRSKPTSPKSLKVICEIRGFLNEANLLE